MLLSFVMPELIIGVTLLFVFANLLSFVHLGTKAQLLGLVTFQVSYPVIIVRARMLSIGKEYEEAAMDLGASPVQALRRVLLPLLYPAIFASAVLVFADAIDDFVIVRYLSLGRVDRAHGREDLQQRARGPHAGAERARHDHAHDVARADRARLRGLPDLDARRTARRRPRVRGLRGRAMSGRRR